VLLCCSFLFFFVENSFSRYSFVYNTRTFFFLLCVAQLSLCLLCVFILIVSIKRRFDLKKRQLYWLFSLPFFFVSFFCFHRRNFDSFFFASLYSYSSFAFCFSVCVSYTHSVFFCSLNDSTHEFIRAQNKIVFCIINICTHYVE